MRKIKNIYLITSLLLLLTGNLCLAQNVSPSNLKAITPEEVKQTSIVTGNLNPTYVNDGRMMACVTATNDNFANAQALVVNGGLVAGSTCGTLEPGETTACNTSASSSVWYSFVATATTLYVQISLVSGSCYFGSAVYGTSSLPTTSCPDKPISCQSSSNGPATQIYQLTNLIVGNTYHIQVVYPGGGPCGTSNTFNIGVTTTNPGGFVTNPGYINTCATSQPGCYFLSPPSTSQVTTACTSYPLAAAGYSANSVMTVFQTFTNSPTASNVSFQAIITSNCVGGNVVWLNWSLYNCSCGLLTCGDINNLTITGLACSGCYILEYQFELTNCGSFTTIWPYQNVPATPIPCTALPLELLYYIAKVDGKKVNLEWATASEANTKRFNIQKSTNGVNYSPIGSTEAAGFSNSTRNYVFTDESTLADGTYFYKLTEEETNGEHHFSKVLVVTLEGGKEVMRLHPNPANSSFDIVFQKEFMYPETSLEIFDARGQKVRSEKLDTKQILNTVDISELPAGIYFISVSTASGKIMKQKLVKE